MDASASANDNRDHGKIFFESVILLNLAEPIFYDVFVPSLKKGIQLEEIGTRKDRYLFQLFDDYSRITGTFNDLRLINIFLKDGKIPTELLTQGLSEFDYYAHHLSAFHVKFVSTLDGIFLFVNTSARMGIPEKNCNYYSLKDHTIYKKTKFIHILGKINSEFGEFRNQRNKLVHRNIFPSDYWENVTLMCQILNSGKIDDELRNHIIGKRHENLKNAIAKFNSSVDKLEDLFLYELLPELNKIILYQLEILELND